MYVSRNVYVPPKQSDLMGFDEVKCILCFFFYCYELRQSLHLAGHFACVCSPQIYLINLRRRPDRRDRMLWSLYELEIDAKVVDAIDGA